MSSMASTGCLPSRAAISPIVKPSYRSLIVWASGASLDIQLTLISLVTYPAPKSPPRTSSSSFIALRRSGSASFTRFSSTVPRSASFQQGRVSRRL